MDQDIRYYARVIWKRRWYAVTAFAVSVVVAAVLSLSAVPVYQATATLFVGQRQVTVQGLAQGLAVNDLSARLLKSYGQIMTSRSIAERAVLDSSLDVSPGEVQGGLFVEPVLDTQVLRVTYRSNDPATAEDVANAVASAFTRQIRQIDAPQGAGSAPAVTVSIIDPATRPGAPIAPNPTRNMMLAAILGIMLGVGVALGIERLDTSVKSREDAEHLGLPVLGSIPKLDTHGADLYLEPDPQGLGGEAFRKLRTAIGFLGVDRPVQTLLVTSPIAREGKTTVAVNLAEAYAQGGYRTVLVEADLRRPSLHRLFGSSGTDGLTTVIIGQAPLERALREGNVKNLHCLPAGAIPPNPVELLESEQMDSVLRHLRATFEMVIVDSPPVMPVADALALAAKCDGVVLIARAGKTNRERLKDSVRQIEKSSRRFLGVVVNAQRPSESPYEYEYYSTYRAASTSTEPRGVG